MCPFVRASMCECVFFCERIGEHVSFRVREYVSMCPFVRANLCKCVLSCAQVCINVSFCLCKYVHMCPFVGVHGTSSKATMAWLRLVGSLKLYVSLENIGLFCRALLQERPIILRSLLIVATP